MRLQSFLHVGLIGHHVGLTEGQARTCQTTVSHNASWLIGDWKRITDGVFCISHLSWPLRWLNVARNLVLLFRNPCMVKHLESVNFKPCVQALTSSLRSPQMHFVMTPLSCDEVACVLLYMVTSSKGPILTLSRCQCLAYLRRLRPNCPRFLGRYRSSGFRLSMATAGFCNSNDIYRDKGAKGAPWSFLGTIHRLRLRRKRFSPMTQNTIFTPSMSQARTLALNRKAQRKSEREQTT